MGTEPPSRKRASNASCPPLRSARPRRPPPVNHGLPPPSPRLVPLLWRINEPQSGMEKQSNTLLSLLNAGMNIAQGPFTITINNDVGSKIRKPLRSRTLHKGTVPDSLYCPCNVAASFSSASLLFLWFLCIAISPSPLSHTAICTVSTFRNSRIGQDPNMLGGRGAGGRVLPRHSNRSLMQRSSYKEPPLPVFCLHDHGVAEWGD